MLSQAVHLLTRVPGLSPLLAFLTARRAVVRGWSMQPTLAPGERVLFDRLAYKLEPVRRGDIVLAAHPTRPGLRLLKRIAAVPGDSVAMDGDRCWVNGEPFADDAGPAPPSARTLGEDEYLLLGDASDFSTDSRRLGTVGRSALLARAWLVYWPPNRFRRLHSRSP